MSVHLRACLLLVLMSGTLAAQAPLPSVRDSIQYRFVDPVGRPSAHRYTEERTGRVFVLTDTVVLDGHGIDSVEVRARRIRGDALVDVIARLRPSAAAVFAAATASHIGQLLVVTIGDRVVATGIIESRIGSLVPLMMDVQRNTAETLAMRINTAASGTKKVP